MGWFDRLDNALGGGKVKEWNLLTNITDNGWKGFTEGKIGPFANEYIDKWKEEAEPDKPAWSPEAQTAINRTSGINTPAVNSWVRQVQATMRDRNPAAQAAASQRARSLALGQQATGKLGDWRNTVKKAIELASAARGIKTTSGANAFLLGSMKASGQGGPAAASQAGQAMGYQPNQPPEYQSRAWYEQNPNDYNTGW